MAKRKTFNIYIADQKSVFDVTKTMGSPAIIFNFKDYSESMVGVGLKDLTTAKNLRNQLDRIISYFEKSSEVKHDGNG